MYVLALTTDRLACNRPMFAAQSVPPITVPGLIAILPSGNATLPLLAAVLLANINNWPPIAVAVIPVIARPLITLAADVTVVPVNETLVPLITILVPADRLGFTAVPVTVGT